MPYPIYIGVTKDGRALIGAEHVEIAKAHGNLSDVDRVYGSQLPHRVRVKFQHNGEVTGKPWIIVTPTVAKKLVKDGYVKPSDVKAGW